MAVLLELKEKLGRIYSKYNTYIIPGSKFLVTLFSMLMLNTSIGYSSALKNPLYAIVIAVLCAFLPGGFMIVALSVVMLVHLYSISAEMALVTLCVVLLMYLLYFRLAPKSGYFIILAAFLCWIKLPYLIPIALGLTIGLSSIIPVSFGVVIYYIIQTASEYEAAISSQTAVGSVQKFSFIVDSFVNNKDMLLLVLVCMATIVVVYVIRRMAIENAWLIAILAGAAVEFILVIVGTLVLSAGINIVFAVIGIILSVVIGYICQVVFFNLDYKRTEVVRYEDDEYYYFVKAVPKINMESEDVKVKRINAHRVKRTDSIKER